MANHVGFFNFQIDKPERLCRRKWLTCKNMSPAVAADFTTMIKRALKRIPKGRVATYGQISELAGSPRGARQVVRILHSSSDSEQLPWHRVINREGKISLKRGQGFELQRALLEAEGVFVSASGHIDLKRYQWRPRVR